MFHTIISPVCEMRKSPKYFSEVVSQAIFSEDVHLIDEESDWYKIKTTTDEYTGWVQKKGIVSLSTPYIDNISSFVMVNRLSAHLYAQPDIIYGPLLTLPFESRLKVIDSNQDLRWLKVLLPNSQLAFIQKGDVSSYPTNSHLNRQQIANFSQIFLGLPYTWGGKSSFGYDCSGFVQMLYRQMGISLPRDSKDQFISNKLTEHSINQLISGDLIFFGLAKDQIRHVALALGDGKFIHTSVATENKPYVRISHINDPAWGGSSAYYPFSAAKRLILPN
jgi:cell wall-associated NlpC family hydrolase